MSAASEFDVGPLTWVKGEIDLALERADAEWRKYAAEADPGRLKFCRTHVHQAHGALTMVGLDGVTQVTDSLEALLQALEDGRVATDAAVSASVEGAIAALQHYLDDLLAGEPNQPLRLLPAYQALGAARGNPDVRATDLFYPDLSRRPPKRENAVPPPSADELTALLKAERARFQKGLLTWLKQPDAAAAGLTQMRAALAAIEASQESPASRTFWWVAQGFLDTLAEGCAAGEPDIRQLCARIDLQIRRLLEGSRNVAERLLRDTLYYVAQAPAATATTQEIQRAYDLGHLLPTPAPAAPQDAQLRRLREASAGLEAAWHRLCAGGATLLPGFAGQARHAATLTAALGHTDLKRLGQSIAAMANWLQEKGSTPNGGEALAMATAIQLLQDALGPQSLFPALGTHFAQQVDRMVDRLHGCIAGRLPAGDEPSLDAVTAQAREKLAQAQTARELRNHLAQVEQSLDAFFRAPDRDHDLAALDKPLEQATHALRRLGQEEALTSLAECRRQIDAFAAPGYVPDPEDFEGLAQKLSRLDFLADALAGGSAGFDAFARPSSGEASEQPPAPSLENQLAARKQAILDQADALRASPADSTLAETLKQSLQALQKDADLVADPQLAETARAALTALAADGGPALVELDTALARFRPAAAEAPAPSPAAMELAQSSADEIDAELLAIFLEEAREVLATMAENRGLLAAEPNHAEALPILRRAVHTLKGSGRMVGLKDLGEAAWAVEQTLNAWLRQELPPTPDLFSLLDLAQTCFSAWVDHLEDRSHGLPDPAPLAALAERLRSGDQTEAGLAALVAPAPEPAPEPTVPSAQIIELPFARTGRPAPATVVELPATTETPAQPPAPIPKAVSPILYGIFLEEAQGHRHTLAAGYETLANEPEQPVTAEMTRAAHTLGGTAATVGLMPINKLAIALEHALLRRDASRHPDSLEGLETVHQAILGLEDMFAALADGHAPEPQPALVEALVEIYPPLQAEAPAPTAEAAAPPVQDELDEELLPVFLEEAEDLIQGFSEELAAWRTDPADEAAPHALCRLLHTFKGSARMAGAMQLGDATHRLETRVGDILLAGDATAARIDEVEAACDALVRMIDSLGASEPAAPAAAPEEDVPVLTDTAVEPEGETGAQRATLRVQADVLDQLVNEAGELSIARTRIEGEMRGLKGALLDLTESVIRLRQQLREIEIQAETQMQAHTAQVQGSQTEFDPLELDRFTRFQELTRFMAESVNDVATLQQGLLKHLDDANAAVLAQARINRGLQQKLMGVRMVPFESQGERLYRIVRQTAKETGKRANLEIRGGQVEIDRSVLDKILPALEHMLRNAVTHGIETEAEREAHGKAATGEITLGLQQEGNEIILTLGDDGAGLDPARLRKEAEALGILAPGETADDAQLRELIFRPGFTTASEVSQIAGRGVGMDVVRTEVAGLGGRIEIQSAPGEGTSFRLYLPVTLALTQTLLVRVGSRRYAIPSTMIEQVQEVKEKALRNMQEAGETEWLGNRYPLHFLPHLLGDAAARPETRRQYWILYLRSGTQRVAVQVDELKGNQEVVVKNIGPQLSRVVGIAGATVLGDGEVVLILNPVGLANRPAAALAATSPTPAPAPSAATLPTVLVVDDSLTVRKVTGRLLAREGYQVLTAKDGIDALEQLVDVRPDVVLSDIEMPRMDGFDLLRNIRADERLKTLPVIMITSRTAEKHRNYALELGADHYLGKPYDESELLRLVAGYSQARRPS